MIIFDTLYSVSLGSGRNIGGCVAVFESCNVKPDLLVLLVVNKF